MLPLFICILLSSTSYFLLFAFYSIKVQPESLLVSSETLQKLLVKTADDGEIQSVLFYYSETVGKDVSIQCLNIYQNN